MGQYTIYLLSWYERVRGITLDEELKIDVLFEQDSFRSAQEVVRYLDALHGFYQYL